MKKTVILLVISFVSLFLMGNMALAETELNILNGGFEVLPEGVSHDEAVGRPPYGWCATGGKGDYWSVELANEKALSGKYSMKITVNAREGGILFTSKPVEVQPGKTYAALWHVFNIEEPPLYVNQLHLYMEFWPEGGWWGETDFWSLESWKDNLNGIWTSSKRVGVFWAPSTKMGGWEEIAVVGTAPSNAKYVTISVWVPNRTLKGYVDDVRLAVVN